jgi:hypothetical protein
MKDFQGPSLIVHDNMKMTEEDWEGLIHFGNSKKLDDLTTSGKYGRGFSSVYHLTDAPSCVSGPYIGISDPHTENLNVDKSRPGKIYFLRRNFKDVFSKYLIQLST